MPKNKQQESLKNKASAGTHSEKNQGPGKADQKHAKTVVAPRSGQSETQAKR